MGRYGDPLNPNADIDLMNEFKCVLKDSGRLMLSVSVGQDAVWWNLGRRYGEIRLPLILDGWKTEKSWGFKEDQLRQSQGARMVSPLWLLSKN